jgi:hypothetical protein
VLATGVDNNVVPAGAQADTGFDPFGFQTMLPAPAVTSVDFIAQALLLLIGGQTSSGQAPGDQVAGREGPDAANVFDNPFTDPYAYLADSNLADLAPAAGGQACILVEIASGVRLVCGAGGGLPGLAPAAGGPTAGPALDPGLSLQDLLDMWLFNFGAPFEQPAAAAGTSAANRQAAL